MNDKFLIDLVEHHNEWVKIVRGFGEYFYTEDIVQEMYLKLSKHEDTQRFYRNGKLYKGFIWITLRNMFVDFQKSKLRLEKVSITEAFQLRDETESYEKTNAKNILDTKTAKVIDRWHWYDKMLFNLYRETGLSYRQIEKETGISFKSVYSTIKNCKKSLKHELGECYEDLINEDYELIK
jgi:RNA polymerase sigma factor (sigma-70 family)